MEIKIKSEKEEDGEGGETIKGRA